MKTRIQKTPNRNSVNVLNRLLAALDCSLARYLSYARPWVRRRYLLLDAVARRMSYDHEIFARKLARLIHDRRGAVQSNVFPMEFTSYNDLALEYLAPQLLAHQHALIAMAESCADLLDDDAEARRVVDKITASLERYAELLEELLVPDRGAPMPTDKGVAKTGKNRVVARVDTERSEQPETQTAA